MPYFHQICHFYGVRVQLVSPQSFVSQIKQYRAALHYFAIRYMPQGLTAKVWCEYIDNCISHITLCDSTQLKHENKTYFTEFVT